MSPHRQCFNVGATRPLCNLRIQDMKHSSFNKLLLQTCTISLFVLSCNKPPYKPDYTEAGGYVIANETCSLDASQDYWLVDLTYYQDTPQYGDTITINNTTFTNVVKVKGLDQRLKQIGMTVSFDFKTVTPNRVETTGCSVTNSVTYKLKELFIINQFEIR